MRGDWILGLMLEDFSAPPGKVHEKDRQQPKLNGILGVT